MIRFFVMDVDGTLTDGKVYIGQNGELFKAFDVKDGYGIKHILPKLNIIPIVITSRESDIVRHRCRELDITECYQGSFDKYGILMQVIEKYSNADGCTYGLKDVMYVGDDIPDLQCMEPVKQAGGLVCCPNNATQMVKDLSDYVSPRNGGDSAVRDIIEWLVNNVLTK